MKVVKNIIAVCLLMVSSTAFAQLPDRGDAQLLYRQEFVGGVTIHTAGWGVNFRYGKQITNLKKLSFGLDVVNIKHPKEKKVFNPAFDDGKGFYYGKLHALIAVRPTIGFRQIWFQKKRPQGVEIGYNFNIGPSLGIVKPVYLEIIYPLTDGTATLSEERFDPNKHTVDNIYGRARFGKGMNEISIYPGVFSKFGLHFEYSTDEEALQAIEVGAMIDYYPKKVPLMAIADNYNFFLNFYVSLIFGKKYF
ncbi:MAG TPA: hypothetical protein VK177_00045 [Flavobacteriales bacterium]|nr:hypothetical protein [Flavobacteriales bacterium]